MSKTKLERYTAEFKAWIALEAIKGEQTVVELGQSPWPEPHHDCQLETAGCGKHGRSLRVHHDIPDAV